jgi:hypothetical protein
MFDAAIGRVALSFAWLEDRLSRTIGQLLKLDGPSTGAVTAEMSFRNKVHLFASLVRLQVGQEHFNLGSDNPQQYVHELVTACFQCEELRNTVMHSSWSRASHESAISRRRTKTTAKASRGLHTHEEDITAGDILDMYDYMIYIEYELTEFMATYGEPFEVKSPAT